MNVNNILSASVRGSAGHQTSANAWLAVERGRYIVRSILTGGDFTFSVMHYELQTELVTHSTPGEYKDTVEVPEGTLVFSMGSGESEVDANVVGVSLYKLSE